MKKCKVYLKGAYGPGNLGDDVLMVSIINVLKERFQAEDIVVGVEEPNLARNFDPQVNWVHYKIPYVADYVVYGGGGQFFSFKGEDNQSSDTSDHGFISKLNNFIKNNPNPLYAIQRLYMSRLGALDNLVYSENVASYCIGLGPFEIDGKGVDRLKEFIGKVDFCAVRDSTSAGHFLNYGGKKDKLKVFKDPSFYSADWFPNKLGAVDFTGDITSYILRGWPYSGHGQDLINTMALHAKKQKENGKKVRMVSLFKEKDQDIIDKYPDFDWLIYDIDKHSIESFMVELLSSSKYICSSRAHGVWLPTILGFPVLAVGIENKLVEVQKGLSECSMITTSKSLDAFDSDFNDYCNSFEQLQENITQQVSFNREQAIQARTQFLNWVDNCYAN